MYKRLVIKAAALVSALIALNTGLNSMGYGMILPMWAMYVALGASIIVLLAFVIGIVMHGGHACYMCCHSDGKACDCGKMNCNCK